MFTRVCFGDKPSPPIAEHSMIKIAKSGENSHPHASMVLYHKRYMDDIGDASLSESNIEETRNQVDDLIGKFGFDIKTWFSNRAAVGQVIVDAKVLGLKWNCVDDTLKPVLGNTTEKEWTKCLMLGRVSEIWD